MDSNKHLAYKNWLDELNSVSSGSFFPTLKRIIELFERENPDKIKSLLKIVDEETRRLVGYSNRAIKQLEPFLTKVEKATRTNKHPKIQEYKEIKSGIRQVIGEDLPDSLYHAIRLSIEASLTPEIKEKFDEVLTTKDGITYVDYEKMSKKFPAYKEFKEYKQDFSYNMENESWGHFHYLSFAVRFFKNAPPESLGSFVKPEVINRLRQFILYLLTPESQDAQKEHTYSFDRQRGLLKIEGEEIKFRKGTAKLRLLDLVVKNRGWTYYGEVSQEFEGSVSRDIEELKNKCYEICRGIETRLLKAGVEKFLEYNFNRARINPSYEKVKAST